MSSYKRLHYLRQETRKDTRREGTSCLLLRLFTERPKPQNFTLLENTAMLAFFFLFAILSVGSNAGKRTTFSPLSPSSGQGKDTSTSGQLVCNWAMTLRQFTRNLIGFVLHACTWREEALGCLQWRKAVTLMLSWLLSIKSIKPLTHWLSSLLLLSLLFLTPQLQPKK